MPINAFTYTYMLLPVLLRQLRQGQAVPTKINDFLARARAELNERQTELAERNQRYLRQIRSRLDSRFIHPCFECEQRVFLYAQESLNGLERYLTTRNQVYLHEAQAEYSTSEALYETLIRLRLRLPPALQEDLQRAA